MGRLVRIELTGHSSVAKLASLHHARHPKQSFTKLNWVWHKARSTGRPVRIEFTENNEGAKLSKHYKWQDIRGYIYSHLLSWAKSGTRPEVWDA